MSSCVVIRCSLCAKEVHHGSCGPCTSTKGLVPFAIGQVAHFLCDACLAEPIDKLLAKYPGKTVDCECFFCDVCSSHVKEPARLYIRWESWGKDVCAACCAKTSFQQFTDTCKHPCEIR